MSDSPRINARPAVYIDVVINDQKQIYDVDTARRLCAELSIAIKSLDGATNDNAQEDDENLEQCR